MTRSQVLSTTVARTEPPSAADSLETIVGERPKNIILVIADGMGFGHLAVGRTALHGIGGEAAWDGFPVVGWQRSHPSDGLLVDSAAAATALSTGEPTYNGAVGVDAEGGRLETLLELASRTGRRIGIVTDSYVWDGTPAAFSAHAASREEAASILEQQTSSKLEVLFGELEDVGEGEVPEWQETVDLLGKRFAVFGPEPVTVTDLLAVDRDRPVAAIFEEEQVTDLSSEPNLATLQQAGLHRLLQLGEPFVLLVESEEMDSASHRQDLERVVKGMEVIEAVLTDLLDFAENDCETLVLFTSDHETGGLGVRGARGNSALRAAWGSTSHTGAAVPLMATGPGAEHFAGMHESWEVGRILKRLLEPAPAIGGDGSEDPV